MGFDYCCQSTAGYGKTGSLAIEHIKRLKAIKQIAVHFIQDNQYGENFGCIVGCFSLQNSFNKFFAVS